jgi:hypothetical protein
VLTGQWLPVAQQSPVAQQNPFWQWPLMQSLASSHAIPFGTLGTQDIKSQCAPASQSESPVHIAEHMGGV